MSNHSGMVTVSMVDIGSGEGRELMLEGHLKRAASSFSQAIVLLKIVSGNDQ